MDLKAMGQVGLTGVRGKAARKASQAISERTSFDEDQVAAILGALLLALTVYQTIKVLRQAVRAGRGERVVDEY
jgi:hypothetical protein